MPLVGTRALRLHEKAGNRAERLEVFEFEEVVAEALPGPGKVSETAP